VPAPAVPPGLDGLALRPAPPALPPDRPLETLLGETLLGEPAVEIVDLSSPWTASTRTERVTLADGRRVVIQRAVGGAAARATIGRRIRLGRLLPAIAPWLPVPEVRGGEATGPRPCVVTGFVPGISGRELLADDRGAAQLGRLMGELAAGLARVPTRGLRLDGTWGDPERLAAAADRWLQAGTPALGAGGTRALERLLRRLPRELAGAMPVFAHGDLAPVNILVRDGGVVALLDFERARLAHPFFDAARWRWIVRHHHPERWEAAGPAFLEAAGLEDSPATARRLDLLAALQCLEMLHGARRRPPAARREWAARVLSVLDWAGNRDP
jgi:aminoglycoside phosphotransferase (APT) family kinase protein